MEILLLWFCAAAQRKNESAMPLGFKNQWFRPWTIHFQNYHPNIFSQAVKISKGAWHFDYILRTFEIYRKMACSIILVLHVKWSLEIEKKCQKPMDLKNLRFSPKGNPRKEHGGECFAPLLYLDLSIIRDRFRILRNRFCISKIQVEFFLKFQGP